MSPRKVTAAQAKAARQKKIAIGGAVLLVGIMVIQGPKMLKLVKGGGSETAATAPAPVTPVTPAPVTGAPAATPVSATTPAQTGGTKLVSFETFSSKDPFVSQVQAAAPSSTTAKPTTSQPTTGSSTGSSTGAATGTSPVTSKPTPFASGLTSPSASGTATITVNGKPQIVSTSSDFPKGDPIFTLVSVGRGTAQVMIAGGALKAGGKTFTITTAKPTTLLNTANDKQYTLKLVSTTPRAA